MISSDRINDSFFHLPNNSHCYYYYLEGVSCLSGRMDGCAHATLPSSPYDWLLCKGWDAGLHTRHQCVDWPTGAYIVALVEHTDNSLHNNWWLWANFKCWCRGLSS